MSERHDDARGWLEVELANKEAALTRIADEVVRALVRSDREQNIQAKVRIASKLEADASFLRRAVKRIPVVAQEDDAAERRYRQGTAAKDKAAEVERTALVEAKRREAQRHRAADASAEAQRVLELLERIAERGDSPNDLAMTQVRALFANADLHDAHRLMLEERLAVFDKPKRKASSVTAMDRAR